VFYLFYQWRAFHEVWDLVQILRGDELVEHFVSCLYNQFFLAFLDGLELFKVVHVDSSVLFNSFNHLLGKLLTKILHLSVHVGLKFFIVLHFPIDDIFLVLVIAFLIFLGS
jgi:hypothetical protein